MLNIIMNNEKKIRIGARLPEFLYDWLTERAKRYHASDFTAALVTVLLKAREVINEEENWIRQKRGGKERIGESLVRLGKMKKEDAENVLRVQRDKYSYSRRFGEIAVEMGILDQKTLDDYLDGKGLRIY
jgi:hypothetical protein